MSSYSLQYYYNLNGLPTGNWQISYDFAGSNPHVGNSGYYPSLSGKIVNLGNNFSGNRRIFNGNGYVQTQNVTGDLTDWTMLFSFEKTGVSDGVLFSNFSSGSANSGFAIGVNSANKIYLESYDENGPTIIEHGAILSNRNAVAITKLGLGIYVDYFDFNSKTIESTKYDVSEFSFLTSKNWYFGGYSGAPTHFTGGYFKGIIDQAIVIDAAIKPSEIRELFKGFYNDVSGSTVTENSGDIRSYGMKSVAYLRAIDSSDNSELYTFPLAHNKIGLNKDAIFDRSRGEFFTEETHSSGSINLYVNGVGQLESDYFVETGDFYSRYYILSGDFKPSGYKIFSNGKYTGNDKVVYDNVTGRRINLVNFSHDGSSNQNVQVGSASDLVFFNGIKLVSGQDYTYLSSSGITFPISNPLYEGATGVIFTMPSDDDLDQMSYYQGIFSINLQEPFARNTSMFWVNGIRQNLGETYIETSSVDMISGSGVFSTTGSSMFVKEESFWESL